MPLGRHHHEFIEPGGLDHQRPPRLQQLRVRRRFADALGFVVAPLSHHHQAIARPRHRDVQRAHALRRFDRFAPRERAVIAQGRQTEERHLPLPIDALGASSGVAHPRPPLVQLSDVHLIEVETLGLMDGENRDRVEAGLARPCLLRGPSLGDALAQLAQDYLDIASAALERREHAAKEAIEVGNTVVAEIARGLDRVDRKPASHTSYELVGRPGSGPVAELGDHAHGMV